MSTKKELTIYPLTDFDGLRKAGRLAAETLDYITDFVKPGVTTAYLDDLLEQFMRAGGGIPANIGYHGFPKASCISPNHVVCHGIPSERKVLQEGDIINIDITVILNGWYGDTSRMYYVGKPSVKAKRRRSSSGTSTVRTDRPEVLSGSNSILMSLLPSVFLTIGYLP